MCLRAPADYRRFCVFCLTSIFVDASSTVMTSVMGISTWGFFTSLRAPSAPRPPEVDK